MTKRRIHVEPIARWRTVEIAQIEAQYPHMATRVIALMLETEPDRIYSLASRFGWKKSDEFNSSGASGRTTGRQGINTRFQKGQPPANKGLRRPGWYRGRMRETQFRKGRRPHTWRPVGSISMNSEGYRVIKVSDTGYPPRDWVALHRLNWIGVNGPIPPGHMLSFRDRNRLNPLVENLELITRVENMRRNTIHNLPKPLASVIQLRGALVRQINKRTRREKQDRGSA